MKKIISTDEAPLAIGPYSQAVIAGDFIFISGQLPIDPENGEMPNDVQEQTRQSLENIKSILTEAELDLRNVVKTTIYISDMNDFSVMNDVYSKFFNEPYPARAAVEVARLPKDAFVEIEVIACKNG